MLRLLHFRVAFKHEGITLRMAAMSNPVPISRDLPIREKMLRSTSR